MPAAGLPWFMAVFGRDSIITSLRRCRSRPSSPQTTLKVLAARQGSADRRLPRRGAGKILHESRLGELTAFAERPHSPYFGSADATPLFLVLLDEYERWTGDAELVRELERPRAPRSQWIDDVRRPRWATATSRTSGATRRPASRTSAGRTRGTRSSSATERSSKLPRACCEIQGYAYDAKVRCARLARRSGTTPALAARLESEAARLKERFNRDFWMPERECFALAIDGDGRQVDSITSNIGHLLWSGIVDDDKAPHVVEHLMGDALFSGWGIRTMAEGEGGYNPIGYHVGTVWPHDNSIIALGLNRYGYREEAARIASGILQAARYFHYRLPEAFAGYPRERTLFPVEYPTACSPQAWATGAPLLFLRTMLGLEPRGNRLMVDACAAARDGVARGARPSRALGRVDAVGRRPTPGPRSRPRYCASAPSICI